jgi:DNA (cytosine-5)-methyltransferase 1
MGARSEISETITLEKNILVREVVAGRFGAVSKATALADSYETPADLWDAGELRSSDIDLPRGSGEGIVFADIFCGAGGLSQGVHDACMALGVRNQCAFGADQDQEALAIFSENLKPAVTLNRNISHLVDYLVDGQADSAHFAYPPSLIESRLDAWRHKVTLLVGGPPCQGHSNLNNKTRREDPRNLHYLSVPALAIALNVRAVVIENVPDVRQDKASVFSTASALLKSEGFHVDSILMNAVNLGIPQTRKRLFLVATKGRPLKLQAAYEACARGIRPLSFAINDLETIKSENVFDSTANIDAVSQSRIDYLFDHSL